MAFASPGIRLPAFYILPMKLLDLYCGAGGAGYGYWLSGFSEVTGVDLYSQPQHPSVMKFVQADALDVLEDVRFCRSFDAIHASPVCKGYSVTRFLHKDRFYPDHIPVVRRLLRKVGLPYVIENVVGAPLIKPLLLCGSMFGLKVIRHRLFESNVDLLPPGVCNCCGSTMSHRGMSTFGRGANFITVAGNNYLAAEGRLAMGIDWMSKQYLSQAIPPAYTRYIGSQLISKIAAGIAYT